MFPLSLQDIEQLEPNALDRLAELDARGLLIGAEEDFAAYRARLRRAFTSYAEFERVLAENGEAEPFAGITVRGAERIPDAVIAEAGQITRARYGFETTFVPGFFLSAEVGPLWGGCSLSDTEEPLTVFLIRSNFRDRKRFFIYSRSELLAHELCHTARSVLRDVRTEEYFAYQTSTSALRRYLGNCFIRTYDALLFTAPALILLAAQLIQTFWNEGFPVWIFWCLLPIAPGCLLIRNALTRRLIARGRKKLAGFAAMPDAVLFRLRSDEIAELAAAPDAQTFFDAHAGELRFDVMRRRFIANGRSES